MLTSTRPSRIAEARSTVPDRLVTSIRNAVVLLASFFLLSVG